MNICWRYTLVLASAATACGDNVTGEPRIVGALWADDNGDGVRDPSEAPLAGFTVFLDLDASGTHDASEPQARTTREGTYELEVPGPGTYTVQQILPFGFRSGIASAKPGFSPIIGGSDAVAGQYGFMVAVGAKFGENVFPFCGGVLISDRHVVTAAHCSEGEAAEDVAVIAGTLDPFEDGLVLDVANITLHPNYAGDPSAGHDLALWTLAAPVALAANSLTTVELMTPATVAAEQPGTVATTTGWGVSDRDSVLLQQVHVPLVSAEDCALVYPESTNFETQICAGTVEGGVDSCQGDSGGPLLVRDAARGVWLHAGITSYGDGCALADTPGVYARVSALADWVIDQTLEPGGKLIVTVDGIVTADFPTRPTTRAQVGEIDARWQLTAMTLPETVTPDAPLAIQWSIFGEGPLTDFTCRFDPDGAGTLAAQDVACGLGSTTLDLASGLPIGIFPAELTVTRTDVAYARRVNVFSGNPPRKNSTGALSAQDPLDPDYSDPYRVDYFDVTALTGAVAFAVEIDSTAFEPFLTLYDADLRDFVTGGGILAIGDTAANGKQRVVVVPEAGRRYLIGVSSFAPNDTGSYVVSIINNGTLVVH